jgi:hypothetical protein
MRQCPICFNELEVRECAPCDDCGWDPIEIEHFKKGEHTYAIYEIFNGLKLTLCNFCDVDFGSYDFEYFGFERGKYLDLHDFNYVKDIEFPQIETDKFCPACSRRLKFLNFVFKIRQINASHLSQ